MLWTERISTLFCDIMFDLPFGWEVKFYAHITGGNITMYIDLFDVN